MKYNKETRLFEGSIDGGDLRQVVGFFEGEGSICITLSVGSWHGSVQVSQAEVEPLKKLQEFFGGNLHSSLKRGHSKRRIWEWVASGHRGRAFLELVLPYLWSPRNRLRATEYIKFFSTEDQRERAKILARWRHRRQLELGGKNGT